MLMLSIAMFAQSDGIVVSNQTMSTCKYESKIPTRTASSEEGEWLDYSVEKREAGLYIHFVHENIFLSCGSDGVECTTKKDGSTISIDERVIHVGDEDCICPYDVTYDVGPLPAGDYTLIVTFFGYKRAEIAVHISEPLCGRFNIDEYVTSIEKTTLKNLKSSKIIYDLSGRRYSSFPFPGIYIKDGRKVVKKE